MPKTRAVLLFDKAALLQLPTKHRGKGKRLLSLRIQKQCTELYDTDRMLSFRHFRLIGLEGSPFRRLLHPRGAQL